MMDHDRSRGQNAMLAFTVAAIAGLLATAVASAIRLCKEDRNAGEAEAEAGPELTYTQAQVVKNNLSALEEKLGSTDGGLFDGAKRDLRYMARNLLVGDDSAVAKQATGEIDLPGLKALVDDFVEAEVSADTVGKWAKPGSQDWCKNVEIIREFDEWAFQHRKAIVTEWTLYKDLLARRAEQAATADDDEAVEDKRA